jgi:hypothetical protein
MFELLLDVMDPFLNLRNTDAERTITLLPGFTTARSHRIGAHTDTDQTVPYGTALWGGAAPGTSCQATIVLSLRDISLREQQEQIDDPGAPGALRN